MEKGAGGFTDWSCLVLPPPAAMATGEALHGVTVPGEVLRDALVKAQARCDKTTGGRGISM